MPKIAALMLEVARLIGVAEVAGAVKEVTLLPSPPDTSPKFGAKAKPVK